MWEHMDQDGESINLVASTKSATLQKSPVGVRGGGGEQSNKTCTAECKLV